MREVAMMDYLYDYPIERILRHEGIPKGRRQLKFLVRWKNYGQDRDSWIEYSALRDNSEMHKYILQLNDASFLPLIPEKFHKEYNIQRAVRAARTPAEPLRQTMQQLQAKAVLTEMTQQASKRARTRK
jgi:hypothetical protein